MRRSFLLLEIAFIGDIRRLREHQGRSDGRDLAAHRKLGLVTITKMIATIRTTIAPNR